MAILDVQDIHTYYGDAYVLQGLSLQLEQGQILGLLGRNGVGKTTLVNSIVGFTPPRRGRIVFKGADVTANTSFDTVRSGMGLVPQGRRVFAPLSVRENLVFAQSSRGPWTLARVYELFPRLEERQHQRGNTLSGGEQQMLAIGRALLMNPSLLLMDEPSEGLAPLIVRDIGRIIGELKQSGIAILLAEQNLAIALSVADRCYVLNKGQVVAETGPQALRDDEELKHRFLGV